jgi:hypothetical protein
MDFLSYVNAINAAITPFDMQIRSSIPQTGLMQGGEKVYALVNTQSDMATQMATTHSVDEIGFVKRVLDAMFEINNAPVGAPSGKEIMAITQDAALRLGRVTRDRTSTAMQRATQVEDGDSDDDATRAGQAKTLNLEQCTTLLKSLVAEGWLTHPLEQGARSYYVLSPRALMELKEWLIETYNDPVVIGEDGEVEEEAVERIKMCQGCNEIVISGQRCQEKKCGARIHDRCVAAVMRAKSGGRSVCPICEVEWTLKEFVGVRAESVIREKYLAGANGERGNTNGRRRRIEQEEEEEDGDED